MRFFDVVKNRIKHNKICVEIGAIRNNSDNYRIGDGHATLHWLEVFDKVYTYDIDENAINLTKYLSHDSDKLHAEVKDGVLALKEFNEPIDFLYLDAWDVIPGTDYKEKHLEAFKEAEKNLHNNSLVLIDDMEHGENGKGALVIPYALNKGWKREDIGKQTMLLK